MAFFKGSETYSIDNKGRLNIPAKMRKNIPDEAENALVITRGFFGKCIFAYPINEWEENQGKKLKELNQYDPDSLQFLRMLLEWSEDVVLDSQQRVMLPKKLLDFAGIEGKVTIIGAFDHIEFWDPQTYENHSNGIGKSFDDIAKTVMLRKNE